MAVHVVADADIGIDRLLIQHDLILPVSGHCALVDVGALLTMCRHTVTPPFVAFLTTITFCVPVLTLKLHALSSLCNNCVNNTIG